MKPVSSLLALWLLQFGMAQAAAYVPVGSASTFWMPMQGNFDYHEDQQTGQGEADIVGDTTSNYGFLVSFHDNDTVNSIDGSISFRVRLDDAKSGEYSGLLWVGIDANSDGKLDVFLGANMQGNNNTDAIEIRSPGTDENISPNTTSIGNDIFRSYALDTIEDATRANYNFRQVDFQSDGGDTNDVTGNGDTDYYLSFMVPFADIVEYLGTLPEAIDIDDTSPLRFVVATARQSNSLNQDIGGLPKNFDSNDTWENLGGFTPPFTPVPEPSGSLLLLGSLAGSCLVRRRR